MVASKMASTVTVERACTGVFLGSNETCGCVPIMRIVNLKNPSYHYRQKTRNNQAEEENPNDETNGPWRQLHTQRYFHKSQANGLWRDATCWSAGVGTAARYRWCDSCSARGGCGRRQSHRYERLLRSARNQRDHQTGASSLFGWTGDSHQTGCSAGRG